MKLWKTVQKLGTIAATAYLGTVPATAQEAKRSPSYTVALNQDNFLASTRRSTA